MKKVLLSVLAVGMLTACSQDETVDMQAPSKIAFAGAFVDNVTRAAVDPSITTATIANFDVWGYMTKQSGVVFNHEKVWKAGETWTYAETQNWVAGKQFSFAAVAPSDQAEKNIKVTPATAGDNVLASIDFTNVNAGNIDLLYATSGLVEADDYIADPTKAVDLKFNHKLSKVKFTFTNGFANENANIKITNIKMTAPEKGTYTVAPEGWAINGLSNVTLDFGGMADNLAVLARGASVESANECLTIPAAATQKYTVTFDVEVFYGDVQAFVPSTKTVEVEGVVLEIGKAYNFTTTLDASNFSDAVEDNPLVPIKFNVVKVENWIDVANEDLNATIGGTISKDWALVTNAHATATISLADGVTFDGAGHTLAITKGTENYYDGNKHLILMQIPGSATIKNLTIDGNNQLWDADNNASTTGDNYGIRGIYSTGSGTVTLDNVTIKNVAYTFNDNVAKTLKVINSTLEGWTYYNSEATFENVNFTVGSFYAAPATQYSNNDNGTLRPYGNTTLRNCNFAENYWIDMQMLKSKGNTIKFENCTYNGTLITKDNISTLNFIENYDASVVVW